MLEASLYLNEAASENSSACHFHIFQLGWDRSLSKVKWSRLHGESKLELIACIALTVVLASANQVSDIKNIYCKRSERYNWRLVGVWGGCHMIGQMYSFRFTIASPTAVMSIWCRASASAFSMTSLRLTVKRSVLAPGERVSQKGLTRSMRSATLSCCPTL